MCGIFAAIRSERAPAACLSAPCRHAATATRELYHRGPDARGWSEHRLPGWATVTLAQTRLKIVDQSDIAVPYRFPQLQVALAFNGEIYNWRELRQQLTPAGAAAPWLTSCDAEVLAAAWRRWGPEMLHRLNGMWGFVLVDELKGEIFIARDRAGEKPVYAAAQSGVLYIASEVKALPVALTWSDGATCPDLDTLEFDCGWTTPWCGVHAFPPGSCLHLTRRHMAELEEHPYDVPTPQIWWRLPIAEPPYLPRAVAVEQTKALLEDAVSIRIPDEVPYAVQLSGGLDSAIIQAIAGGTRLYCITFPEIDNLSAARQAVGLAGVCGAILHPVTFGPETLWDLLPQVARYLDTPATWTAICQYVLNKRIADDGSKVVLSGEGADELFWGYARYRVLWHLEQLESDPRLAAYGPLISRMVDGTGTGAGVAQRTLCRGGAPDAPAHARALFEQHGQPGLVAGMARTDFYTTMQVLLRMGDRMSAAHSLENRSPFLDYRLLELAPRIAPEDKLNAGANKHVLREVARAFGVSPEIVDEKTKRGLAVPQSWFGTSSWDRGMFRDRMNTACREGNARSATCDPAG